MTSDSHSGRAPRFLVALLGALAAISLLPAAASAAVTATWTAGTSALTAGSNSTETIAIDCIGGNASVTSNASPVAITNGPAACTAVHTISVTAGTGNTLTLSGINPGDFASLTAPIAITGGAGTDTINGSQVADTIQGGGSSDTLNGNAGDDTFTEGGQGDAFDGGLGFDTLTASSGVSFFQVGASTISYDAGDWTYSNLELINAHSANSDSGYSAQNATAALNASSTFTDKNDNFVTGPFNDTFSGGPAFIGDMIVANTDSPVLTLTTSSLTGTTVGTDTLVGIEQGSFTTLGGTVDNVWDASGFLPAPGGVSPRNVSMQSGEGNDTLTGTNVSDSLDAGPGDDILSGRGGNETLQGGVGTDTAKETGVASATVTSTNMTTNYGTDGFAASIEKVDLTGTDAGESLSVTTFAGSAKFDGAGGADALDGGAGGDDLTGGVGVDSFTAEGGADTVHADDAAADGLISCGAGTDVAFADPVDTVDPDCETVTRVVPDPGGGTPGGPGGPGVPGGTNEPDVLSPVASLTLGSRRFAAASSGGSIARAAAVGTRVTYSLSEAAAALFTVQRALPGRKVGKRCVRPTRTNRKRKRCTRWVGVKGSFSDAGESGSNSFTFTGRLRNRKLRPGRYRLTLVATDAAGNRSLPKRSSFKIVRG